MPGSIRERISEDLQKARSEGGLRTDRIKAIVKAAVAQAIAEVKTGSSEIGIIAQDAIAAVADNVKGRGQETAESLQASIEATIEGISEQRRDAIAETQSQVEVLQTEIVEQEQQLQSDIEGALVKIETSQKDTTPDLKSIIATIVASLRDSESFTAMQEQYARLRAKLAVLDANMAARYGERYEDVKKHLDTARVWYDDARTKMEQGDPHPVHHQQIEFDQKLSELGVALAQKEQQIKERLKELWLTATKL